MPVVCGVLAVFLISGCSNIGASAGGEDQVREGSYGLDGEGYTHKMMKQNPGGNPNGMNFPQWAYECSVCTFEQHENIDVGK